MQTMQQITGNATHQVSDTPNPQLTTRPKLNGMITALDLDPIKIKLMDSNDGESWSRAKAEAVDREYRRFLQLNLDHPRVPIVPTKDVDKFWHFHILDTMKYAEDCTSVFGRFLHHFPYFGLRGEDDARDLREAAENTRLLYRQTFEDGAQGAQAADCQSPGCGSVVCQGGNCSSIRIAQRPRFEN
jgi:hypothetical protein